MAGPRFTFPGRIFEKLTKRSRGHTIPPSKGASDEFPAQREIASISSDPEVLETFFTAACSRGCFDEAEFALFRLRQLTGHSYDDMADTIDLGQNIEALLNFSKARVAVRSSKDGQREPLHHGTVSQAVIGAAERRKRLDPSFARTIAESLLAYGVLTDAAIENSLRLLLALDRDACGLAFYELVSCRLSDDSKIEILNGAIASAVRREAMTAVGAYIDRFTQIAGGGIAGLIRLASHMGVGAFLQTTYAKPMQVHDLQAQVGNNGRTKKSPPSFPALAADLGSSDKIDVFLKCVKRPFDIQPFVAFWLECFEDSARYRLRLLDDSGLNLSSKFSKYSIADTRSLRDDENEALAFLKNGRRPLNKLGWESVANLTPFAQTGSRWFWNIDADDLLPILDSQTNMDLVRRKLRDVEDFAVNSRLVAISYDIWASAHYLFDHGYHWTFGICFCRSDPELLGQMLAEMSGCDDPPFGINLDHLFSRLSDGRLGDGRFRDYFASFVFERPIVLQKDVAGRNFYHGYEYCKKRLAFDRAGDRFVRDRLHPKTLVV